MRNSIFAFFIILIGFVYYSVIQRNNSTQNKECKSTYKISYDEMKVIDTGFDFLDIFFNNLFVGAILSIFGFLSGGLATILVLFWNGYLLGIVYVLALRILHIEDILYFSKHIPFEIIGLILFSKIGLKGFLFFKEVLLYKKVNRLMIPEINQFILPISLLFIASIIETL